MEVVASLSQGRTAAAQCGLFKYKSVPVIFETPCTLMYTVKVQYMLQKRQIQVSLLHTNNSRPSVDDRMFSVCLCVCNLQCVSLCQAACLYITIRSYLKT